MALSRPLGHGIPNSRLHFLDGDFNSQADSLMFIHHSTHDVLILLIHVDNILVTGNNST